MKERALILLMLVSVGIPCWAQNRTALYEPKGPERKAILDALRALVEKELMKNVVFRVGYLQVKDGWAFLAGKPQQPNGKPMDYRDTPHQKDIEAGVFDDGIHALMRLEDGRWRVVKYEIGATDAVFEGWDRLYHAPKEIFWPAGSR